MQIKPTLSVGIPAYNEEANIGFLIEDLLKQKSETFDLKNIIVASDASTDKTDIIVKTLSEKYSSVMLFSNNLRQGQAQKQNQIINSCDSDILVLLNADILISGLHFLEELVKPILQGYDLTSGKLTELSPETFFEKIIGAGYLYKRRVFEKYNNGNNVFTCHGSHRAFSKRFYKNFQFKQSISEDAFSYLSCVKLGFNYCYTKKAEASIKLPANLNDHGKQSNRFFNNFDNLSVYFDKNFIKQNYKWPYNLLFTEGIKLFILKPVEITLYLFISLYLRLKTFVLKISSNNKADDRQNGDFWSISQSSKVLRS